MAPVVVGIVLSLVVVMFGRGAGFDRERSFYPTVLVVTASYYVLFAVMGGSTQALVAESIVMTVFVATAVTGFKSSRWIAVAGLVAHAVLDSFHGRVIDNDGVPAYWPAFCLAFDIGAAACLALVYTFVSTERLRVL